jgi:hypothetical protein
MKLSIIIPVDNQEDSIEEVAIHVIAADLGNIEKVI